MSKILIVFAHPLFERSRVHAELIRQAAQVADVTISDLYEKYPEFDIDVAREKELLTAHDIVVWQHPFYWYSSPPLLKQWQDLVLEHGWAYGKKGHALSGKKLFNAITSGGSMTAYQPEGFNKYSIHDFLRPFERTAELCRMTYLPPFWVHTVHRMEMADIRKYGEQYKNLLTALSKDIFPEGEIMGNSILNDLIPITSNNR